MRFALIATTAAAAAAMPFAVSVGAPQMSDEEFLTAVRCAAYEKALSGDEALAEARWLLNSEARRQPAETVVEAEAEVKAIALQAVNIESVADAAMMYRERAAVCSNVQVARGANRADAV